MKLLLILFILSSICFGEYEKGKIDMHGGKEYKSYEKRGFKKPQKNMMHGLFLDQNSSKNNPGK
ncbi:MAG: hypothetical protein ABXS93_07250 [Sulfurimonas sp.]